MYVRQRRPGRPKWKPELKDLLIYHESKKRGLTEKEIADKLNISISVLNLNKKIFKKDHEKRMKNEGLSEKQLDNNLGSSILDGHPFMKPHILKDFADVGYPVSKLCKLLNCDESTFWRFMDRHPRLKGIFKLGKEYADMKVLKSLQKRALGMKVPKVKHGFHQGELVDTVKYWEILPPDVTACFNWLINRQNWVRDSDKPQQDHKGKILEALDQMTNNIEEKDLDEFDKLQEIEDNK